jgi:H-type lectin domain
MSLQYSDFVAHSSAAKMSCERAFISILEEAYIEGTTWRWEAELDKLRSELTQIIEEKSFDTLHVSISQFDTQNVRSCGQPQLDIFDQVNFTHPFVAPPRLPHGIRGLDVCKSANIRVSTPIRNISNTSAIYHVTSWADTTIYSCVVDSLNFAPANWEFLTGEHMHMLK